MNCDCDCGERTNELLLHAEFCKWRRFVTAEVRAGRAHTTIVAASASLTGGTALPELTSEDVDDLQWAVGVAFPHTRATRDRLLGKLSASSASSAGAAQEPTKYEDK